MQPSGAAARRQPQRGAASGTGVDQMHSSHTSGLRESYDHLLVRREGHVLEVTINRPDVRNCLHPPANDELDDVFDAYFADEDLWVAILVGAGNKAFSSGADLAYLTSGR